MQNGGQKVANNFVVFSELFDLITDGKKQVIFAPNNKYFDEVRCLNG